MPGRAPFLHPISLAMPRWVPSPPVLPKADGGAEAAPRADGGMLRILLVVMPSTNEV